MLDKLKEAENELFEAAQEVFYVQMMIKRGLIDPSDLNEMIDHLEKADKLLTELIQMNSNIS